MKREINGQKDILGHTRIPVVCRGCMCSALWRPDLEDSNELVSMVISETYQCRISTVGEGDSAKERGREGKREGR